MQTRVLFQRLPRALRHRVVDAIAAYRQRQRVNAHPNPAGYWSAPIGIGNDPNSYARDAKAWDGALLTRWAQEVLPRGGTVLEFGCNAGRLLHRFATFAHFDPIGVELNPHAITVGRQAFPILSRARFLVGDGTETLAQLDTASVDLAYTSHALRHVSPSSIATVARELARVTSGWLITSEDEGSQSPLTFARNYRRLFEPLGWREVRKVYPHDIATDDEISLTSVVRLFRREHHGIS